MWKPGNHSSVTAAPPTDIPALQDLDVQSGPPEIPRRDQSVVPGANNDDLGLLGHGKLLALCHSHTYRLRRSTCAALVSSRHTSPRVAGIEVGRTCRARWRRPPHCLQAPAVAWIQSTAGELCEVHLQARNQPAARAGGRVF